ncbi:hypothetical protein BGZ61DRAFT_203136 [Ilyonectria robusta]|uniref:uncharacterized protein n=1 Tax=Ilyonectria robusta TaxID=1079257 RepID=UPI001E8D4845|nr:uncharacterized protein BGZ61DRAFT_203136 [Ilyonectria robusta]KAH8654669.1 hypothetical protein BGZ61DRAFT_203136 [Ilyonectria robusta]
MTPRSLRDTYPGLRRHSPGEKTCIVRLHKISTCVRLILSQGKRLTSQALNSFRKALADPVGDRSPVASPVAIIMARRRCRGLHRTGTRRYSIYSNQYALRDFVPKGSSFRALLQVQKLSSGHEVVRAGCLHHACTTTASPRSPRHLGFATIESHLSHSNKPRPDFVRHWCRVLHDHHERFHALRSYQWCFRYRFLANVGLLSKFAGVFVITTSTTGSGNTRDDRQRARNRPDETLKPRVHEASRVGSFLTRRPYKLSEKPHRSRSESRLTRSSAR